MNKKNLNISALIIALIVIINEIQWIGKSKIAFVILGLSIAVGLNALSGIVKKD